MLYQPYCGSLNYLLPIFGNSGKLPTFPSPKPTFYPNWEISANVDLGDGKVSSFPEMYNDPYLLGANWFIRGQSEIL